MKKLTVLQLYDTLCVTLISLFYVTIIVFWTHGKLLFGGDQTGYYNYYNFLQNPTFSGLIWVFSELVTFGNVYFLFYLHLYLGTLFSVTGIYMLTRLVFNNVSGRRVIFTALAASILFLFNPWSVSLTYLSLTGDVSIGVGGLTFFFIGILLFLNSETTNNWRKFSPVISGVGLGIAQSPFPNYIRLLAVVLVIFIAMGIILLIRKDTRRFHPLLNFSIFAFVSIAISIAISLEYFIPIVSNIHATVALASSGAADKVYLGFYTGQFNDLLNELRGLNGWQYPGIFYYYSYERINILSIISFLWPLLALVLPLILIRNAHKSYTARILIIIAALLVVIFWDKGANAPFGQIWTFINSFLPTGYQFIPTGYLSGIFLDRFYPILAAFSLTRIYGIVRSNISLAGTSKVAFKIFKRVNEHKEWVAMAITVVLALLLIASAYPTFAGYAETYSYNGSNQSNKGFYIPQYYNQARTFLVDNNNGSVLLLPPTTSNPYITTDWGYSGEIGFYSNFFAPVSIVTLNTFGGTYSNATQQSEYNALTQPLINPSSPNVNSSVLSYVSLLEKYDISYFLVDSSITGGIATSANQSLSLVNTLIHTKMANIVFSSGSIVIATIHYGNKTLNSVTQNNALANTMVQSTTQIYSYNENASLYQTSGYADVWKVVTFSVPGYNGTEPLACYENETYLGQSLYRNVTFPPPGIYQTSAKLPNRTILGINYTVNRKMTEVIAIPNVVIAGTTVYLSRAVFGGTTLPERGYNWEWFINGVYQKNIGDRNYDISIKFKAPGTHHINLMVHDDGLGENASVTVIVHALNPTVYRIETSLRNNITPGSIFYFIIVFLYILPTINYDGSKYWK